MTSGTFEAAINALPLERVTRNDPDLLALYGVKRRVPNRNALRLAIDRAGFVGGLAEAESIIEERIRSLLERHGITR